MIILFEVGNNKNLFKKTVFADRVGGQLRRIGDQHICGGKSKTAVRFFGRNTWLEKLFQREKKRLRRVFNMKNNRMHLAHDCNMKPFLFGFGSSFDRVIQKNTQHSGKSEQIGGKFCDFLRQLEGNIQLTVHRLYHFCIQKTLDLRHLDQRQTRKGVVLIDQNAAARDDTGIKIIPKLVHIVFLDVACDGGKNIQVIVLEPSDVLIMIFELCHVVCQIFLLTSLKLQLFVGLQCVVKHKKNQDVCCCEAENQDSVEEQNIARIMKQTAENDVDQENAGTDCDLQQQKQLNPRRDYILIRDQLPVQTVADKQTRQDAKEGVEDGEQEREGKGGQNDIKIISGDTQRNSDSVVSQNTPSP